MFCGGGFELSVVFRACFGVLFWMLALRPQVRTVAPTGANRRGGLSPSISLSAASWSYRYVMYVTYVGYDTYVTQHM